MTSNAETTTFDPIRFCVFTTVALIAWVFGPPVAVMLMSGLGLWAYSDAWRKGLRQSKCVLRDPRLVMAYLGAAFVLGAIFSIRALLRLFS